ncbi:MAG: hypothetical protein HYY51_02480 [Candidatus Magasanikbacteria bacterium]|nr:hypothetical protein [Candidatus Magasanikbacteria bacterium]
MLPTRLNLLSPNKKDTLRRIIIFQFIKNAIQILLIVTCLTGIVLLGAQPLLETYFSRLASNLTSINKTYSDVSRKIQEINTILREADSVQSEYTQWSDIIQDFSLAIPSGIKLKDIEFTDKGSRVSFSGEAQTREQLLELKQSLENMNCKSWCIASVPLPPSLLTQKEHISFSITADATFR